MVKLTKKTKQKNNRQNPRTKGKSKPIQTKSQREAYTDTLTKREKGKNIYTYKKKNGGFPGGAVVENLPANAGDTGSNPSLGGSHIPQSN